MERINHWNETNTNALIQGISGIAGNIINAKNNGAVISVQDQQIAALAQQTQAALLKSQTPQSSGLGAGGITTIVLVGVVFLAIVFMLHKFK